MALSAMWLPVIYSTVFVGYFICAHLISAAYHKECALLRNTALKCLKIRRFAGSLVIRCLCLAVATRHGCTDEEIDEEQRR